MRIKTFIAAAALATLTATGLSTTAVATAAPITATGNVYFPDEDGRTYIATYPSHSACVEGGHAADLSDYWVCEEVLGVWELYVFF